MIAAAIALALAAQSFDYDQWTKDVRLVTDLWKMCLWTVAEEWAPRDEPTSNIADDVLRQCTKVEFKMDEVFRENPSLTSSGLAEIKARTHTVWRQRVIAEIEIQRARSVRKTRTK